MSDTKLISFKGDEKLKALLLEEIVKHRAADEIVQGSYGGKSGPWCAVGCAVHSLNVRLDKDYNTGDHSVYETELGIPRVLAKLEDRIFEGLKPELAKDFPQRFIEAVPVGVDLSVVWPQFALWLLSDETNGVIRFAKTDRTKDAINGVAALYKRVVAGEVVGIAEWRAARNAAAYAAAAADADYAAYAAAAAAAAAYAADADAAADAAYAAYAAYAAAAADARHTHFECMANKLIEIIAAVK